MSTEPRAPGWYPDPWGTDDDRYFDGGAWTRSTRRPGGLDTPPDPAGPPSTGGLGPASVNTPAPPQTTVPTRPASAPAGVPPGWHPDPWAAAALRYWDGAEWTGHVSGMPDGNPPTLRLAEERTAGRWARLSLIWAGPAQGASAIAAAFQAQWMADHWSELTAPGSTTDQTGNSGAAIVIQLAGIAVLITGVLFLIWFHRSATLAASSGIHARRSPGLATVSFLIPILNFWWPYQSTCDLLPHDHPGRHVIRRWWALWIGCTVGSIAIFFSAFVSTVVLAVATAATVVLALLAAIAARAVVAEIVDAHEELLARAATLT